MQAIPHLDVRLPTGLRGMASGASLALLCLCIVPLPGCGGDDESGSAKTGTCGDGVCDSSADCETPLRCPEDCGTCVGAQCTGSGTKGSCSRSCRTSCECAHEEEVCTADFGEADGQCVPVDCLGCRTFDQCVFSPDADNRCTSVTCG